MSNSTAAPVVSISQEDIVRIAQTVKEFLIGDLHNLIDEKQKPVLRELKELKIKYDDLDKKMESFQDIITVHESSEVSNNLKAEIKYLKNKCDDLEQHNNKDDKHIVRNNDDFIAMLDELEIEPPTEWSEQPDEAPAATRERLLTHDDGAMSVITGDVGNGGR
ncbi:Hypothetical predicted protein [Mytilus galloprovincialis]|uniref:Uncharacterized protein n=1 Tax=Mytilus galloprovincialis TaxID=29158 RepID=A0A8B6DT11_MYTGA|nr:Hypothetical predicted protein [Mytilus galloprovincialis]